MGWSGMPCLFSTWVSGILLASYPELILVTKAEEQEGQASFACIKFAAVLLPKASDRAKTELARRTLPKAQDIGRHEKLGSLLSSATSALLIDSVSVGSLTLSREGSRGSPESSPSQCPYKQGESFCFTKSQCLHSSSGQP